MEASKLKVASLFAGIGGICLGFKQAECEIAWANEIDKNAANTYRHNFGDGYLVEGDIKKIDSHSIPDIDILTAGFPCQAFSVAGKQRGFADPRGNLFFEVARVVDAKRPRVIFLENVSNLIEHDGGRTFLVIYNSLAQFGYYLKYKVMDAHKYADVPQKRERIFLVAFLNYEDCEKFSFPDEIEPTQCVFDLIDIKERHSECYYYDSTSMHYNTLISKAKLKNRVYRLNDYGYPKASINCPTLVASMGDYFYRIPVIKDDFGIRRITPHECLKLFGFPQDFSFARGISQKDAYRQAGNSVCVPLVKRIAENIMQTIY